MKLPKVNWGILLFCILIPLGIGSLSGILVGERVMLYQTIIKPALSPPGYVFPIVWTILYILMGISSYMIFQSDNPKKEQALTIYAWQLVLNFSWSIVFFMFGNFLLAFVVLVVLWILILVMIVAFYKINPIAAYLQIPYLLWVTFAGYLNLSIYILNR